MMKLKRILTLVLTLAMLAGCLPSAFAAGGAVKIGISMHYSSSERWTRDGETLKAALEEKGCDVTLTFTEGGDQAAQIGAMLAQGIKVLIVTADDPTAIGPALEKAAAKGVKVLAYDRLPTDTSAVDALVTFDSREVGRLQARCAIQSLGEMGRLTVAAPSTVELLGGGRSDPNARWLLEGALEVLAPYIEAGMIKDPGKAEDLLLDSWSAAEGQARMQKLLDAGHTPNAILCGDDNILSGVLAALKGHDELPNPTLVGQDASVEIATKIGKGGLRLATVFKDTRLLAQRAAELADALAKGTALPEADDALNNGKKDVKTYFSPVRMVDLFNYRAVLIDSGYYTAEQLDADPAAIATNGDLLTRLAAMNNTLVTDVEAWGAATGHISSELHLAMDTQLTRSSIAMGIWHFCKDNGTLPLNRKALDFVDADQVETWWTTALEFCNYYGLYRGTGNNYLNPNRPLTRLENEILFQRLLQTKKENALKDPEIAYAAAVADAVTVEPEEVLPLKTAITKDDPNVTWNEAGDKVLMVTWNNHPERFTAGETIAVDDNTIWVFPPKELEDWYGENAASVTDLDLRLAQLLGLPPDAGYTTMTALWVAPEDLSRPAYDPDITTNTMTTTLTGHAKHQSKFAETIVSSYMEGAYPWTRLGYTYDWAPGSTEYGLTEFIIKSGAKAEVRYSVPTERYFKVLNVKLGGNFTDEMKMDRTYNYADEGASAVERQGDHQKSPYFYTADFYNMKSTDSLTILPQFKTYQQTSWWSCGVCAAMEVMNYYGKLGDWNEKNLADLRTDHSDIHDGTCTDQMIEMFEKAGGWDIESTYDYADDLDAIDLSFVQDHLKSGIPVIVGWNDWGGHWAVIIGYDNMGTPDYEGDDVIIMADSFDTTDHNQDGYGVYGAERFIYNFTFFDFFGDPDHLRDKCFLAVRPAA